MKKLLMLLTVLATLVLVSGCKTACCGSKGSCGTAPAEAK
jgi:hypothetical protein